MKNYRDDSREDKDSSKDLRKMKQRDGDSKTTERGLDREKKSTGSRDKKK